MKRYYFDYNATTPVHPHIQTVLKKAVQLFGNPSSLYQEGRQAHASIETVRAQCADLFSTSAESIFFTASGSEANTQILHSIWLNSVLKKEPCHFILSSLEHPSLRNAAKFYESLGASVSWIPATSEGLVDVNQLLRLINPHTKLISVMAANNETGLIQPLEAISQLASENKILFHTDAVQWLSRLPLPKQAWNADFITFSAHKLYSIKGTGVLFAKQPTLLQPLIHGGHQERDKRAGTESVLNILALGEALKLREEYLKTEPERQRNLCKTLFETLKNLPGFYENSQHKTGVPGVLNIGFEGISGETLLMKLDLKGFSVSTGSACSTGTIDASPILIAMGQSESKAKQALRISLGLFTQVEDIHALSSALKNGLQ